LVSVSRLSFIVGLIGLGTPSIADFAFIAWGCFAHYLVGPYFGFSILRVKKHNSVDSFIPLPKWATSGGEAELSGHEYKELVEENDFSTLGKEKLEAIKEKGTITYYDVFNLTLFEEQIGEPAQYRDEDERLKNDIKNRF
jgi:hypothetical protein